MTLRALHDAAREKLDPVHYDYVAGGAGEERVLADNERAFDRYRLLPRVLRGSGTRDTAVGLPGARRAAPVVVAPTAFHRLVHPGGARGPARAAAARGAGLVHRLMHPDGERATARAAAAEGAVLVTGTAATTAVDGVVEAARAAAPDPAVWFQLYLHPRREVTEALVRRAEEAGCTALVVTVDSPVFGRHTRDLRNGFTDLPPGHAAENMRDLPGAPPGSLTDIPMSPALSWRDLGEAVRMTSLPVLVKGILHPADARLAVEHGAAGVIVSNHGGRQCDTVPASVDCLPAVAGAVAERVPVLLDGGVRRGGDVAVALALGATAVGVGRPVMWGLAAAGEAGVRAVLAALRDEYDHTLALCGGRRNADLTQDMVVRGGRTW
ncbi:alpha-hydroxy acid oxidase [Streptomyces apricus]|uniref:Alpha-hydroxy-acid oxidizing protein n=1 Tax=Streptomyces apricus TaxID=1828112 RepID=A0A5B0A0K7_9ACTN|nr:alpha-hydroxy acid oxidase [Streptomyces apricus]KAA0923030.1 alpha-hydroxy-acid oxidizing protein [Streptomyces apricus]